MKRLSLIALAFILAATATVYFVRDPGTADIALLGWNLQTSALGLLALLLVTFVGLSLAWRILAAVLNIPAFWRQRTARQKRAAADEQLLQAWAELARGRFDIASKLALTQHKHASIAPMHYVVAADALLAKEDTHAALNVLNEVRANFPRFADYLALHIANRLQAQHNLAPAIELLHALHLRHPKDEAITCALAEALYSAADWEKLAILLPVLRRLNWPGLTEQNLQRLSLGVYRGLIDQQARQQKPESLTALWADVPKALRSNAPLLISLAQAWLVLKQPANAELVLEKALSQHGTNEMLRAWLAIPPANPAQALGQLDGWMNQSRGTVDEATRAYATAYLAWLSGDEERAQKALAPSLANHPDVPALKLAADIAQHQRDSVRALALLTQAFNRLT
jgi:HemY protein